MFLSFQNQIHRSEKSVKDHQDHHDALQAAVDWLTLMKDRLSTCSDTSGDRHTLQNKLERVKVRMNVEKLVFLFQTKVRAVFHYTWIHKHLYVGAVCKKIKLKIYLLKSVKVS